MESEYKEIIELFELFDYFSEERFHNYTSCFNVKLKEAKRNLKNTENRLAYNMVRC
jgi:phenylalanyl-tRNA synthetase beta subunit